jgi:hypothetical protein
MTSRWARELASRMPCSLFLVPCALDSPQRDTDIVGIKNVELFDMDLCIVLVLVHGLHHLIWAFLSLSSNLYYKLRFWVGRGIKLFNFLTILGVSSSVLKELMRIRGTLMSFSPFKCSNSQMHKCTNAQTLNKCPQALIYSMVVPRPRPRP